jgi:hypothetical protein
MTKPFTPRQKERRRSLFSLKRRLVRSLELALTDARLARNLGGGWQQLRSVAIRTSEAQLALLRGELARMKPGVEPPDESDRHRIAITLDATDSALRTGP